MVGKKELICNIDDVAFYIVPHNSTNGLRQRLLGLGVVEEVSFINKKVKSYSCRHFKMMRESINRGLHARVVVERILVKVVELRSISL